MLKESSFGQRKMIPKGNVDLQEQRKRNGNGKYLDKHKIIND